MIDLCLAMHGREPLDVRQTAEEHLLERYISWRIVELAACPAGIILGPAQHLAQLHRARRRGSECATQGRHPGMLQGERVVEPGRERRQGLGQSALRIGDAPVPWRL